MTVRVGKKAGAAEVEFELILDSVRQFALSLPGTGSSSVGVQIKCQWMPENRNLDELRRERAFMAEYALRKTRDKMNCACPLSSPCKVSIVLN